MFELLPHVRYIWRAAISDVRHRYAGAGAGVLWNVLQPLSMILIYSLVFANIMDRRGSGRRALRRLPVQRDAAVDRI